MTPLAHAILKDACLPRAQRAFKDESGIVADLYDAHCFEVTEVMALANDLADDLGKIGVFHDTTSFLPAPKTWIEWREGDTRIAAFLCAEPGERWAERLYVMGEPRHRLYHASPKKGRFPLAPQRTLQVGEHRPITRKLIEADGGGSADSVLRIFALLLMINTTRGFNRRTHRPHAGLQRQVARARGKAGKFQLHGWTEIKLEVRPPSIETGEAQEAWLTGGRAWHFVRAHLKPSNGVFVSAYWRGDPALGMKRTRYRLVPPKDSPETPEDRL